MFKLKFIAELCQNHNGSLRRLLDMVDRCADNGADIIKMQSIYVDDLTFRPIFENGYRCKKKIFFIKRDYLSEYRRLKKLEINYKETEKFVKRCISKKVIPMTTCFSRNRINDLYNLGFRYIKVASYDCGSFQMIRELSERFKYLIISTGATFDSEIIKTNEILKKKKIDYSFLHCVTSYPTSLNNLHLSRIKYLFNLTKKNIGYSDHSESGDSLSLLSSKASIYFGAKILERHMTILDKSRTKDGMISIKPEQILELKDFASLSKEKQKIFLKNYKFDFKGNFKRKLSEEELLNREYYRGRFASYSKNEKRFIYNWEEIPIN